MNNNNFNEQVINAVKNIKGCQFVGIDYVSSVKLNKSQESAIGGTVSKFVSGTFQINYSYENAVNNRAEKAVGEKVDFIAQSLRWGAWVDGQVNKLIEHNGEMYLRFYGVKNETPSVTYYVNGVMATNEQIGMIKEFVGSSEKVGTQSAVGLEDNQVIARSIKIDNISELRIGGIVISKELLAA